MAKLLTNYPIISEVITNDIQKIVYDIYISNMDITATDNIDTTLDLDVAVSDLVITVKGLIDETFVGYICIRDEIIEVTATTQLTTTTEFTVVRAKNDTVAGIYDKDNIDSVRSVEKITDLVMSYRYKQESDSPSSKLFSPVLGSGNIRINDDVKNWVRYSATKKYNISKNKFIYIFEGAERPYNFPSTKQWELFKVFEGYVDNWNFSTDINEVSIDFKDRLNIKYTKEISSINLYKNTTFKIFLEQEFGSIVNYSSSSDATNFLGIDYISTKEYKTYGELLGDICFSTMSRMIYNEYGEINILSDVKYSNLVSGETLNDEEDLLKIKLESENSILINKIICNYKNRMPYNDTTYFDGDYVKFKGSMDVIHTLISTSGTTGSIGFNSLNLVIGADIKYVKIGDYVKLVWKASNTYEFNGQVYDIFGTGATGEIEVVFGRDKDLFFNDLGKFSFLIGLGLDAPIAYTLYYGRQEYLDVFQLSTTKNSEDTAMNLQIPILPYGTSTVSDDDLVVYNCSFGGVSFENSSFTGIIEDTSTIYGTHTIPGDLTYLSELTQNSSMGDLPIYLQTNKLGIAGLLEEQHTTYTSFSNENIILTVEATTDTSSDFIMKFKNTITPPTPEANKVPIDTVASLIEVSSVNWALIDCGDVLMLASDVTTENAKTYLLLQKEKWLVKSKFISSTKYWIALDKPYPYTSGNYYTFKHFKYSSIILLNSLSIKGNPVMETESILNSEDATSILGFGENSIELSGKILSLADAKKSIKYIKNNFRGLDEDSYKILIPFSLPFRPDIGILDIKSLTDNSTTGIVSKEVIVISKEVVNNGGIREENYVGIPLNYVDTLEEVVEIKTDNSFKPVALPTYEYNGVDVENTSSSLSDDALGVISFTQIDPMVYSAVTNNAIRDSSKELEIVVSGNIGDYNLPIFDSSQTASGYKICLIKINKEFILCGTRSTITTATTNIDLIIEKRGVFGSTLSEIATGESVEIYRINDMTYKGESLKSGDVHLSLGDSKVIFDKTKWTMEDFLSGDFSSIIFKQNKIEGFKVFKDTANGQYGITFGNIVDKPFFFMAVDDTEFYMSYTNSVGNAPIFIDNMGILSSVDATALVEGSIKYSDTNKLQLYNGASWETYYAQTREIIIATTTNVTVDQCRNTIISNYGQTATAYVYLPDAVEGLSFQVVIATSLSSSYHYYITAGSGDVIYLDGVVGSSYGFIESPILIPNSVRMFSFKTAGAWHWNAITDFGTWTAG